MKKYDSYKDSGVEWIGKIPAHWDISAIKHFCDQVFAGGTPSTSIEDYWDGDIDWLPSGVCHDNRVYESPKKITQKGVDNSSTKFIPKGTALLAMTGATCGHTAYCEINAYANQSVTAYINDKKRLDSLFLWYLLQSGYCYIDTFKSGGAQGGINVEQCKNLVFCIPPLTEQQAIASYLDAQTVRIDRIIEAREKKIKLLEELRASIISKAVTKGLRKNVETKDSGIEWIGQIPKHWEIGKVKFACKINGRIGFRGYTKEDLVQKGEGAYTIGGKHITNCVLDLSEPEFISWDKFYESPEIMVKKGDILTAQRGSLGKTALIREEIGDATINPSLVLLNNIKINRVFFYYYLVSNSFLTYIEVLNTSTAVPMISQTQLSNINIPLPEIDEQNEIADYLDLATKKIEVSIMDINHEIELLTEYRSSLIKEVVTGKRKVV